MLYSKINGDNDMYQFNLSRKSVTSKQDGSIVGYNYYIIGVKGEEIRKELIYTTVGETNALELTMHDLQATSLYDDFIKDKTNAKKNSCLRMLY